MKQQPRPIKRPLEQKRAALAQAIDLNTIDTVELQLISIYREMSPKMRNALMVIADMGAEGRTRRHRGRPEVIARNPAGALSRPRSQI